MAKEKEATRREIIEESIEKLRINSSRQAIINAYNEMADDKELMTEWLSIANNSENLKW